MPDQEYLTVDEAADLLRSTAAALYQMRYRDQEPATLAVRVGRRLLFRRADLTTWFDERLQLDPSGR